MKIDLATFLPYQLTNIATLVSNDLAEVYQREFGLTIPQWRILANLAQYGTSTATALCEQANMDKSTVSRAIKALIEKQLISSKPNPHDKRAALLLLSAAGLEMYSDVATQAAAWEQQLLSEFTESEYQQLMAAIEKLKSTLQK